jgi:hypothetical protein
VTSRQARGAGRNKKKIRVAGFELKELLVFNFETRNPNLLFSAP